MNKKQRAKRIKYLKQEQKRNTDNNAIKKQQEKAIADILPDEVKHDDTKAI